MEAVREVSMGPGPGQVVVAARPVWEVLAAAAAVAAEAWAAVAVAAAAVAVAVEVVVVAAVAEGGNRYEME